MSPVLNPGKGMAGRRIGVLSPGQPYSEVVLATANLLGYWRLGETSGTVASDAKGTLHGTYQGTPTLGTAGATGDGNKAVTFDGVDDQVLFPAGLSLAAGSSITIEFWNYVPSSPAAPGTSSAFTVGNVEVPNRCTAHVPLGGTVYWDYGDWSASPSGRISVAYGAGNYDKWTHVALTYDVATTTRKVYLNGASAASGVLAGAPAITLTGGYIGAFPAGGGHHYGGIDEFAIYDRALTAAEILAHYSAR